LLAEMANQGHLDILAKGVEAWNAWRKDTPQIQPDFSEIDLGAATLERRPSTHRFSQLGPIGLLSAIA
jgi:hypothetical protein